jgi:acetyl esterase/lipase
MVDDVACAIEFARNSAAEFSTTPDQVTVVGYSAGAHLAALAAYAPGEFGQDCPSGPSQPPDAFVGLAGPYDVSQLGGLLAPLFGGTITELPEVWAAGNPLTWLADAPNIPALLIHGDADRVAPVAFSEELAAALTLAGKSVALEVLPGRSHGDVTSPRVVADRITAFLATIAS